MKDYSQILRELDEEEKRPASFGKKHIFIGAIVFLIVATSVVGFVLVKQKNTIPAPNTIIEPDSAAKKLVPLENTQKENTQVYDLFQQNNGVNNALNNGANNQQNNVAGNAALNNNAPPVLQPAVPEPPLVDTNKKITQADLERELEAQKRMLAEQKFGEDQQKMLDDLNKKPPNKSQSATFPPADKVITQNAPNQQLAQMPTPKISDTNKTDQMMENAKVPPTAVVLDNKKTQKDEPKMAKMEDTAKANKKKAEINDDVLANNAKKANNDTKSTKMTAKMTNENTKAISKGGEWRVQFASLTNAGEANNRWEKHIRPKVASQMGGLNPQIERAQVGGVDRFRIQAVGFKNRDSAVAFCQLAKSQGLECIPIKP